MSARQLVVMSAIPQELEELRRDLEDGVEHRLGARPAAEGRLGGKRVVLAEAGIGKVNAAVAATRLIDRFSPEAIIFTGVAGGLDPDLHVGDVVIGGVSIQHDAGVIENGRISVHQAGHVPFFNPCDRLGYRPGAALLAGAIEAAGRLRLDPVLDSTRPPQVVTGAILTGDQFVNDEITRDRLHREFGAVAVDMEGAAVAQVCESAGVDCLVIRALSDLAGAASIVDFQRFVNEVAANAARIVRATLELVD